MSFWDQMETFINDSISFTSQAYEKALERGNLIKMDFELKGLQGKAQKEIASLGGLVHRKFIEGNAESVSLADAEVKAQVDRINELQQSIKAKQEEIEKLSNQPQDQ